MKRIYSNKFKEFGTNPKSVFWKSTFTQDLRLELIINILLKFNKLENNKISDVGCGYGRLIEKLNCHKLLETTQYYGVDINKDFITFCKSRYKNKNIFFHNRSYPSCEVDFTIMSGTYNLCTFDSLKIWENYLTSCLIKNWEKTKRAMIFNLLEKEKRVIIKGLYYCNSNWIKEFCEFNFGTTKITKSNLLPDDMLVIVYR